MAVRRGQSEPVYVLEPRDLRQRFCPERRLPLERVQHDPLEQITQREVEVLRQRLEHFEGPLLDADPSLYPLHGGHHLGKKRWYHGTKVSSYCRVMVLWPDGTLVTVNPSPGFVPDAPGCGWRLPAGETRSVMPRRSSPGTANSRPDGAARPPVGPWSTRPRSPDTRPRSARPP